MNLLHLRDLLFEWLENQALDTVGRGAGKRHGDQPGAIRKRGILLAIHIQERRHAGENEDRDQREDQPALAQQTLERISHRAPEPGDRC